MNACSMKSFWGLLSEKVPCFLQGIVFLLHLSYVYIRAERATKTDEFLKIPNGLGPPLIFGKLYCTFLNAQYKKRQKKVFQIITEYDGV